jgi:tetratricopeptide (TPR) repeat protein
MTTGRALGQNQHRIPLILFAIQGVAAPVVGILQRTNAATGNTTILLGFFMLLVWGVFCLAGVYLLATRKEIAQRYSAVAALVGFLFAFPVLSAQAWWFGLALLVLNAVILYFSWDEAWGNDLLPAGVIAGVSWSVGFFYAFMHASLLRSSFIGPTAEITDQVERQVLSTGGFSNLLTFFYLFLFTLIILAAIGLMMGDNRPVKTNGSMAGYVTLVVLFILGFFLVSTTNLRVIQADIVYKRARPLERLARRQRTTESWEFPIAIYERAIDLAPWEDFYYLFLGAAYLEQSGVTQDPAAQTALLETARDRLLRAQEINPLNTDHTANLARLTTRWAAFTDRETPEFEELVGTAQDYYLSAMELSPRNSTIRNEYANLLLSMAGDCDAALEAYETSLEIDPSYNITYLGLAGAYQSCAQQEEGETRNDYFRRAAELVLAGLEINNAQNEAVYRLQAAQLYRQATEYELAMDVLEDLRLLNDPEVQPWQIDLEMARILRNMDDLPGAIEFAERALETAPAEQQETIQQFLDAVTAQLEEE